MSRSSTENKLVTLQPGEYLRAGPEGDAHLTLEKETQGLIIRSVLDGQREDLSLTVVLVNGQLINVWSEKCSI